MGTIKPLLGKFLQFHELSALFDASMRRVFFLHDTDNIDILPRLKAGDSY